MKNIWKVFRADGKRITTNVVALIVLMGLAVIPCLYAWFNILSNWDPYSSEATGRMKIAVYSEDEGIPFEELKLCIGDTIVENLKANDTVGWVFSESSEDALAGVYSGEYYAALIIPENFSADMVSFLGGEIENPKIHYYENSKKNAIANKITSKAKTAVQQEVNASLVRSLAEILSGTGKLLTGEDSPGETAYYDLMDNLKTADSNLLLYIRVLNSFSALTEDTNRLLQNAGHLIPDIYSVVDGGNDSLNGIRDSAVSAGELTLVVGELLDMNLDNALAQLRQVKANLHATDLTTHYGDVVNNYDTSLEESSALFDAVQDFLDRADPVYREAMENYEQLEALVNAWNKALESGEGDSEELEDLRHQLEELLKNENITLPDMDNPATDVDMNGILQQYHDVLLQVGKLLDTMGSLTKEAQQEYREALESYRELQAAVDNLAGDMDRTTDDADGIVRDLEQSTDKLIGNLQELKTTLDEEVIPSVSAALTESSNSITNAKIALDSIHGDFDTMNTALDSYDGVVTDSRDTIATTVRYLNVMERTLSKLIQKLEELTESNRYLLVLDLLANDTDEIADFIASPVELHTVTYYKMENYGSAMAPFYTVLALWVGALLLVSMIHVPVLHRPELEGAGIRFYHRFFGRYLLFFLVAEIQAVITALGNLFFVQIQCPHPWLFLLGCMLISFVFSLFIYSLTYALGNAGEAVAVIIMVIQVAGAGGTFPVQVLPNLYQMLYQYLPFVYALDALRECIGGLYGNAYRQNILILLCYGAGSIFFGLLVERPSRFLRNLIDESKEKSGLLK